MQFNGWCLFAFVSAHTFMVLVKHFFNRYEMNFSVLCYSQFFSLKIDSQIEVKSKKCIKLENRLFGSIA